MDSAPFRYLSKTEFEEIYPSDNTVATVVWGQSGLVEYDKADTKVVNGILYLSKDAKPL